MHEHQATITPTRPAAPAWVLIVGAACLLMALLLTAFGPSRLEPVSTTSAGSGSGGRPATASVVSNGN